MMMMMMTMNMTKNDAGDVFYADDDERRLQPLSSCTL